MVAKKVRIMIMLFFAIAYRCTSAMASESSSITHTLATLQGHLSLLTKKLPSGDPSKSATSTEIILSKADEDKILETMQQTLTQALMMLSEKSHNKFQDDEQFLYSIVLQHSLDKNKIFATIVQKLSFTENIEQLKLYWSNWEKGDTIPDSFKQPFKELKELIDKIYKKAHQGKSNYYKAILTTFISELSLFLEHENPREYHTAQIKEASTNIDKQAIINHFIKDISINQREKVAFQEYLSNSSSYDNEPNDLKELRSNFNKNIEKVLNILKSSK